LKSLGIGLAEETAGQYKEEGAVVLEGGAEEYIDLPQLFLQALHFVNYVFLFAECPYLHAVSPVLKKVRIYLIKPEGRGRCLRFCRSCAGEGLTGCIISLGDAPGRGRSL
jgi:hypothetical protein